MFPPRKPDQSKPATRPAKAGSPVATSAATTMPSTPVNPTATSAHGRPGAPKTPEPPSARAKPSMFGYTTTPNSVPALGMFPTPQNPTISPYTPTPSQFFGYRPVAPQSLGQGDGGSPVQSNGYAPASWFEHNSCLSASFDQEEYDAMMAYAGQSPNDLIQPTTPLAMDGIPSVAPIAPRRFFPSTGTVPPTFFPTTTPVPPTVPARSQGLVLGSGNAAVHATAANNDSKKPAESTTGQPSNTRASMGGNGTRETVRQDAAGGKNKPAPIPNTWDLPKTYDSEHFGHPLPGPKPAWGLSMPKDAPDVNRAYRTTVYANEEDRQADKGTEELRFKTQDQAPYTAMGLSWAQDERSQARFVMSHPEGNVMDERVEMMIAKKAIRDYLHQKEVEEQVQKEKEAQYQKEMETQRQKEMEEQRQKDMEEQRIASEKAFLELLQSEQELELELELEQEPEQATKAEAPPLPPRTQPVRHFVPHMQEEDSEDEGEYISDILMQAAEENAQTERFLADQEPIGMQQPQVPVQQPVQQPEQVPLPDSPQQPDQAQESNNNDDTPQIDSDGERSPITETIPDPVHATMDQFKASISQYVQDHIPANPQVYLQHAWNWLAALLLGVWYWIMAMINGMGLLWNDGIKQTFMIILGLVAMYFVIEVWVQIGWLITRIHMGSPYSVPHHTRAVTSTTHVARPISVVSKPVTSGLPITPTRPTTSQIPVTSIRPGNQTSVFDILNIPFAFVDWVPSIGSHFDGLIPTVGSYLETLGSLLADLLSLITRLNVPVEIGYLILFVSFIMWIREYIPRIYNFIHLNTVPAIRRNAIAATNNTRVRLVGAWDWLSALKDAVFAGPFQDIPRMTLYCTLFVLWSLFMFFAGFGFRDFYDGFEKVSIVTNPC